MSLVKGRDFLWQKLHESYFLYLSVVGIVGLVLSAFGIVELTQNEALTSYFLLIGLAFATQFAATSSSVNGKAGITYQVAAAVVVASIPTYGPFAAALLNSISSIFLWIIKPSDKKTWKKSKEQLFFNMGMSSVSVFVAGLVFIFIRQAFRETPVMAATAPWIVMAVVYDQLNLWLLLGILRLQGGRETNVWEIWQENTWAVPISIMLMAIGGGLLAYAIQRFDWIGVAIFFLPIILSSVAFRLYVRQMLAHMNNLENIIAARTNDLATANDKLKAANQELELLNKEKDAFLAVLTHDMKTPLTTIGIYAELLRTSPEKVIKSTRVPLVLQKSQQTLLDIVNNILDLEKLSTTGTIQLDTAPVNLSQVAETVTQMVEAQATEKMISLHLDVADPLMVVVADRKQIERAMTNLLSNAIKYTGDAGEVFVTLSNEDGYAAFQVRDTGFGIPEDELPHIFDRFRRVDKHRSQAAGTGLGLAITKALVEAHGGHIDVDSKEDVGSTFVLKLPLAGE